MPAGRAIGNLMAAERELTRQELTEVSTNYLRRRHGARGRHDFEAKLKIYEGCVNNVQQMRQTIRMARELQYAHFELAVSDDLLDAFRAWKRREPLQAP